MRLKINKSKNAINYYAIIDIKTKDGKRSTKVYKRLGNEQEIAKISNGMPPIEWARKQVAELNKKYKEEKLPVLIKKDPSKIIDKNIQTSFNVGYLFLQDIYYKLKLNEICNKISEQYQFKFDLNDILSKLIYSRIIFPASKFKTLELSKRFL